MGKIKYFLVFLLILLVVPVLAVEVGFEEGEIGIDLIPTRPINYSTRNVNRSDFWDDLDTPDDIEYSNITVQGNVSATGNVVGANLNIATWDTHVTSDGSDHSFINQNVGTTGFPTFAEITTEGDVNCGQIVYWSGGNSNTVNTHLTSDGTDHTYINQDLRTTASPAFANPTATSWGVGGFKIKERGGAGYSIISVQGQDSGEQMSFELFTKDGDGTDYSAFNIFGLGSPTQLTNLEYIQYGWNPAGYFQTRIVNAGSGSLRNYEMWSTGNVDQFVLEGDGDVIMATLPTFASGTDLYIDSNKRLGTLSSSVRYKKNIKNLTGTERIYDLRPISFDAKDNSSTNDMGLIAEEVEQVYPELVNYKIEPITKFVKDEYQDYYDIIGWNTTDIPDGVEYSRLAVPLLTETQKLKKDVQRLEQENQLLKDTICKYHPVDKICSGGISP